MNRIYFVVDDFGYLKSANLKIKKLSNRFFLINILPNKMSIKKTFLNQFYKKLNWGIHLNLVEGNSVLRKVNTLVDRKKRFFPFFLLILKTFFKKINYSDIEKEMEAQIKKILKLKNQIYELNTHQHIHAFYPYSEIIMKLARKYSIKNIRSYRDIKCFSLRSKLILILIKFIALISNIIGRKSFSLPETWYIKSKRKYIYMSWEDNSFDICKLIYQKDNFFIITHIGLPFDSNKSYYKFLIK